MFLILRRNCSLPDFCNLFVIRTNLKQQHTPPPQTTLLRPCLNHKKSPPQGGRLLIRSNWLLLNRKFLSSCEVTSSDGVQVDTWV